MDKKSWFEPKEVIQRDARPEVTVVTDRDCFVIDTPIGLRKVSSRVLLDNQNDIIDDLESNRVDEALSANQGRVLNEKITENHIEIVNNLVVGGTDKALSATQGFVLSERVSSISRNIPRVADNLESSNDRDALSARQGKILNARIKKSSIEVVDNLNTISTGKALDAHQGRVLDMKKIDDLEIDGQELRVYANEKLLGTLILPSIEIANSLSATKIGTALDAVQGTMLAGRIDNLYSVIPEISDNLYETTPGKAFDATLGRELRQAIDNIRMTVVRDDCMSDSTDSALSANQGLVLDSTKGDGILFNSADNSLHLTVHGKPVSSVALPNNRIINNLKGSDGIEHAILGAKVGPVIDSALASKATNMHLIDNGKGIQLMAGDIPVGNRIQFPSVTGINNLETISPGTGSLDAYQGRQLQIKKIDELVLDGKLIVAKANGKIISMVEAPCVELLNKLNSIKPGKALDAVQGRILNDKIENVQMGIPKLENGLTYSGTDRALNAKQGTAIRDLITRVNGNIPLVENALSSSNTKTALSAAKGKELSETKGSRVGFNTTTRELTLYAGQSNETNISSVTIPVLQCVDTLESVEKDLPLSANQGNVINNSKIDRIEIENATLNLIANSNTVGTVDITKAVRAVDREIEIENQNLKEDIKSLSEVLKVVISASPLEVDVAALLDKLDIIINR